MNPYPPVKIRLWISATASIACIYLLWPVRVLLERQEQMGFVPLMPSRDVLLIAGAIIPISIVALRFASKIRIDKKHFYFLVLTVVVLISILGTSLVFELVFGMRPDYRSEIAR
jgi:hypothetical protein